MRYENPLHLAEEAAALDLLSDGRVALGVSRGSPEPALRGWETFGYTGSKDPRGADLARAKFDLFLRAVRGMPLFFFLPFALGVSPGFGLSFFSGALGGEPLLFFFPTALGLGFRLGIRLRSRLRLRHGVLGLDLDLDLSLFPGRRLFFRPLLGEEEFADLAE